jgi:hemolysin (HlyC) family protein
MRKISGLTTRQPSAAPQGTMTHITRDTDLPGRGQHKSNGFLTWLRGIFRFGAKGSTLRESLIDVLDEHDEQREATNPLTDQERSMLFNILSFGGLRVEDVMVPRADIVAVEEGESLEELLKVLAEASHSRMPVYRETLDDPIGMYHIKDLLPVVLQLIEDGRLEVTPQVLAKQRREVLFAPPSMAARDLFLKMQTTRIHMALVIDEYGGTDGLVTIEDLVEEIVGEIEDEHDAEEGPLLSKVSDGLYLADARAEIDDITNVFGRGLLGEELDEDIGTLGGLIFDLIGRVPHRGELISHPIGIEFEILDADPRRIKKVQIKVMKAQPKKN